MIDFINACQTIRDCYFCQKTKIGLCKHHKILESVISPTQYRIGDAK